MNYTFLKIMEQKNFLQNKGWALRGLNKLLKKLRETARRL